MNKYCYCLLNLGRRRKKTIEQDQEPLNQKLKQKNKGNKKYGKNNQKNDNKEFLAKKENDREKSIHGANLRSRPLSQ